MTSGVVSASALSPVSFQDVIDEQLSVQQELIKRQQHEFLQQQHEVQKEFEAQQLQVPSMAETVFWEQPAVVEGKMAQQQQMTLI